MKNMKKMGVLIAIVLISLLAIGAVSAADDAAVDDVDLATVDEVQVVDTPTEEITYTDTSDPVEVSDTDPITDTPETDISQSTDLQEQADDGDDVAVVSEDVNSKNTLNAEPLRADGNPDLTFTQLFAEFNSGNTINLQNDYKWVTGDNRYYSLNKNIVINGNGHTIDGAGSASLFRVGGDYTITLNNVTIKNCYAQASGNNYYGGVISAQNRAIKVYINNANLINNTAGTDSSTHRGGVVYAGNGATIVVHNSTFINNSAYQGGVFYTGGSTGGNMPVDSYNSIYIGNNAVTQGAVLYLYSGQQRLINYYANSTFNYNVFVNNTAATGIIYTPSDQYIYEFNMDYNWWGENHYNTSSVRVGNYLFLVEKYYILKLKQTSATTIELSLNTLFDGSEVPEGGVLPAREYLLTITGGGSEARITTPSGNLTGSASSNFTIAGNGTITAYVDNQVIALDIYQNTRGTIDLNVTVNNVVLPNKPVAIVKASFDDIYNITVGEKTYQVTVTGGTGQVELDELPEGTYLAMLSHIGNDDYHDAYNLTTFNVTKATSSISLAANTTTPVFGSDVKVTPTVTPSTATGNIIYTLDGKNYAVLEVGQDLIITGLSAGQHSIFAYYGGDDEYQGSTSQELLINVQKAILTLSIVGDEVVYPETGKVTIESNVDGVYTVYVGETAYEARVSLGSGTFAVPTLDVDTYTISVNVAESENYTAASATGTYKVTKATPKFSIEGDNRITYGESNVITPTLTDGATGTITYYVDTATTGSDVTYPGTYTTPNNLDAGSHTIRAVYSGDTNYESKEASFTFTVVQAEADVTVTGDTVIYPNKATISITANVPNTYTITVNNKDYEVEITEAGQTVEQELDTIPIGVYYVSVSAPATTNYKAVDIDKATTVIVNKPSLNLTVYNTTITYGETANVRITLKDGDTGLTMQGLMVAVGGAYYSVDITAGEGTLPLTGLNAGIYNIVAICAYDANYDVAYSTGKVTVNKATPTITVTTTPIDYGQDAEISIALDGVNSEKLTGVVKVTIDGKTYDVAVTDGVGTLTVSGLAANEAGYPITAAFAGNENYGEATNTAVKQVVNKAKATVTISADKDTIKYGETIILSSTLTPADATGAVTYWIGENQVDATLSDLPVGEYVVVAKYAGDDNYNATESSELHITVDKADASITVSANASDITYGDTIKLSSVVTPADATGAVTYYIDGVATDAVVSVDKLTAGEHTVYAKVAADGNYNEATSDSITITVAKANASITVDSDKDTITYGETITLSSELTPTGITGAVTYYIDGTATDASVSVDKLTVGTHTVVAKYAGNENYNAAESVAKTITVNKATPTITITSDAVTYPADADVYITLTGVNNAALPGATVRVTINGVTYAVVTGTDGKAKLTVKGLPANEEGYAIAAVSVADDSYNSATYNGDAKVVVNKAKATVTVSADKTTIKYGETITLSSTLSPADATGAVTYYLDGVETGATLSNLAVGEYTVVAKYAGDNNYNATESAALTITVNKADATITVTATPDEVTYGDGQTITLTANVDPSDDDGTVTYYINGTETGATLSNLAAGTYTITAKVAETGNYNEATSESITITVNKAEASITITATPDEVTYGDGQTITLTADVTPGDDGAVTYYLDGEAINDNTLSGLDAGTYTVSAKVAETGNYNEATSESITITVAKAEASITVSATPNEVTYGDGQTITLSADVTPGDQGEVTYYVDGVAITGETLSGLDAGTYTVYAVLAEDTNYNEAISDSITVTVAKAEASITVSADKNSVAYGETITLSSIVTPSDDEGEVTYYLDGEAITGDVLSGLSVGEHTVVAKVAEDTNYAAATSDSITITVAKAEATITVTATPDEVTYGDGQTITLSADVTPGDDGAVTYYLDGEAINDNTLSGLDAGTYIVYAVVAETGNYNEATSESITFTVKRADASITVGANATSIKSGDTIKLTSTVTPSDDEGTVTYYLDGVAITGDVLSDLSVGTHTVVAKVAQDTNYNAAESNTLVITVGKMGTEIEGQDVTVYATVDNTISFTLKDANGNILAGKTITVAFDGQTYERTTDANGVVTLDVNMANKGSYTISASYAGDEDYESAFASYSVTVKAKATKLTVSDQTYSVSGTKYVTAKLTAGGQPIANKVVTFSLNGKTYTGRTNADGVVKVAVALTAKKTYSVVVSFAGDTTYGSAVATYKLKVTS